MSSANTLPQSIWADTTDYAAAADASQSQWSAGVVFESFGEKLGIRTNDADILGRILEALPPVRELCDDPLVENIYSLQVATHGGARRTHALYRNTTRLYCGKDLEQALDRLEDEVRQEIAYWSDDDYIFVHAGVAGVNGKAVVLPGRSGAGKSTLVAALIDAGATYYSDDMAVLDPSGQVVPYPTQLAIRTQASGKKQRLPLSPAQIGRQPIQAGMVLLTQFDAHVSRWNPQQLSPVNTIMALFDNTIAARRLPKQAIKRFKAVLHDGVVAYEGNRGEASLVADWILRVMT